MTKSAVWAATVLAFASCAGAPSSSARPSTPKELLRSLLSASNGHRYESVRELVHEWRPYEGMDAPGANTLAWEFVAQMMKVQRRDHVGDWSYSDDALAILLGTDSLEFRVAEQGPDKRITESIPAQDLLYLECRGCSVWVARIRDGYELVFWEGMNKLLR